MKLPRIRIVWVMAFVVIVALNFAAVRAFLDGPSPWGEDLLLGALPMADVLVVGLLIGRYRPQSRPFLVGFTLFGAIALACFFALTLFFPGPTGPIYPYVATVLDPIAAIMGVIGRFSCRSPALLLLSCSGGRKWRSQSSAVIFCVPLEFRSSSPADVLTMTSSREDRCDGHGSS